MHEQVPLSHRALTPHGDGVQESRGGNTSKSDYKVLIN